MKIKRITAVTLLVVITLCGCSQGNGSLINSSDEVSAAPTETAGIVETVDDDAAGVQDVSFSVGDETQTPEPTPSEEPSVTATPTPSPKITDTPTSKATPQPTKAPQATPSATPKPTETPKPTSIPMSTPKPTQEVTPQPTPSPTPKPQTGRTICNTCGADITGNVATHGDSHLLNGENFSYRVE